jgi:hypothetical protein
VSALFLVRVCLAHGIGQSRIAALDRGLFPFDFDFLHQEAQVSLAEAAASIQQMESQRLGEGPHLLGRDPIQRQRLLSSQPRQFGNVKVAATCSPSPLGEGRGEGNEHGGSAFHNQGRRDPPCSSGSCLMGGRHRSRWTMSGKIWTICRVNK